MMSHPDPALTPCVPVPDAFHAAAGQAETLRSPALDTRELFPDGRRQVDILHGKQRYSLRLTRENKLILTK